MTAGEIKEFYHLTKHIDTTKQTVYLSLMQADMWRSATCRALIDAEWEAL
jgi:hypothetical protein